MRRSWLRKQLAEHVVVQTRDGDAVKGYLTAVYHRELVLEQARVVGADGDVALAGTTAIPRDNVKFVYLVPPSHEALT